MEKLELGKNKAFQSFKGCWKFARNNQSRQQNKIKRGAGTNDTPHNKNSCKV